MHRFDSGPRLHQFKSQIIHLQPFGVVLRIAGRCWKPGRIMGETWTRFGPARGHTFKKRKFTVPDESVKPMPAEVTIQIDVDPAGDYRFGVRDGNREYLTRVSQSLAASFYEDLRLVLASSTPTDAIPVGTPPCQCALPRRHTGEPPRPRGPSASAHTSDATETRRTRHSRTPTKPSSSRPRTSARRCDRGTPAHQSGPAAATRTGPGGNGGTQRGRKPRDGPSPCAHDSST
jgi:hypothetical protein